MLNALLVFRRTIGRVLTLMFAHFSLLLVCSVPSGNSAFQKGDHTSAIKLFTEALTYDPTSVAILSNRSAAYAAIGGQDPENYRLAEADGAECVKLMPDWSKGYVRQATALFYQKKYKVRDADRLFDYSGFL
jgi:tetratricopeptide (TPR) repeat protein